MSRSTKIRDTLDEMSGDRRIGVSISAHFECDQLDVPLNEDMVFDFDTVESDFNLPSFDVKVVPTEPSVALLIVHFMCNVEDLIDIANVIEDKLLDLEQESKDRYDDSIVLYHMYLHSMPLVELTTFN